MQPLNVGSCHGGCSNACSAADDAMGQVRTITVIEFLLQVGIKTVLSCVKPATLCGSFLGDHVACLCLKSSMSIEQSCANCTQLGLAVGRL